MNLSFYFLQSFLLLLLSVVIQSERDKINNDFIEENIARTLADIKQVQIDIAIVKNQIDEYPSLRNCTKEEKAELTKIKEDLRKYEEDLRKGKEDLRKYEAQLSSTATR